MPFLNQYNSTQPTSTNNFDSMESSDEQDRYS